MHIVNPGLQLIQLNAEVHIIHSNFTACVPQAFLATGDGLHVVCLAHSLFGWNVEHVDGEGVADGSLVDCC